MQSGYHHERVATTGRNFHPDFRPDLATKEMLELGVFCGKYMTDTRKEFPASWFTRAKLSPHSRDCSLNYFGVDASQPLSVWRKRGCDSFRRSARMVPMVLPLLHGPANAPEEDARQIRRWNAMRHHWRRSNATANTCRKRQRQALLHWAYDSRNI